MITTSLVNYKFRKFVDTFSYELRRTTFPFSTRDFHDIVMVKSCIVCRRRWRQERWSHSIRFPRGQDGWLAGPILPKNSVPSNKTATRIYIALFFLEINQTRCEKEDTNRVKSNALCNTHVRVACLCWRFIIKLLLGPVWCGLLWSLSLRSRHAEFSFFPWNKYYADLFSSSRVGRWGIWYTSTTSISKCMSF
jgi:hypothetical protein